MRPRYKRERAKFEWVTDGVRTITTDHGSIHSGLGFSVSFTQPSIANNGKYYYAMHCSGEDGCGYIHFKDYKVWTNNARITVNLYESPDASVTGGTDVTPVCRNRTNGNYSLTSSKRGVSVDLNGATLLEINEFGGGGTNILSRSGGSDSLDVEFVFKKDTDYIFEIHNQSGESADVNLWFFWYEEDLGGL